MADYSLQDFWWNKPSRTESQLPALQLGVQIMQRRAQQDLQERDLANDIARTSLMREEQMFKQNLMLKIDAGNAELARAAAQITDFSDPAQMKPIYDLGARAGFLVGTKGWEGIINTHERAVTAKQRGESIQSMIDERNRRADMAGNIGWVYPEDGSPPYLVDAKGGTKFAPFHAGIESGFTPQKTTIGGIDLIQTSPLRWQVVNKPIPSGRMTDLEKADLSDIRKQRQLLVDALPSDVPKLGMFGWSNKESVEKYSKETNAIAALTAREDSLRKKVEARGTTEAPEPAPPSGLPKINSKEEYDKLEPGKQYIAPDGSTRTKG